MKKFKYIAVIGLVSVGLLSACGENEIEPVESDETEEASASATEEASAEDDTYTTETDKEEETAEEETPTNEVMGMGDAVTFDGLEIKLANARVIPGQEFIQPDKDKFLAVELHLHNPTDETIHTSTIMDMGLLDAESYQQDQTMVMDSKGSLDAEIGPGRDLKGEVVYDVTESEYYEFMFDDPFRTGQAIWKIEDSDIEE